MVKVEWMGEGLAELTRERLAGEGRLIFAREERLAALEKMGLPSSTHFSHATLIKVAQEMDADAVVFGQFVIDDETAKLTARVLRLDPPSLSPPLEETGALEQLMAIHARLVWRVLNLVNPANVVPRADFIERAPRLRLEAFEYYIRGLLSSEDGEAEQRLRMFREAARLEPAWVAPAFAVGQAYFVRRNCGDALLWLSRVPPAHERGAEAAFDAGVCHLLRNDAMRAEAAFVSLAEPAANVGPPSIVLPEVRNNLGVALLREGKAHEAAAQFERATQLDPEDADYWFNLGIARMSAGDATRAAEALRESLRRRPENPDARKLAAAGNTPPAGEKLVRMARIKMRLEVVPPHRAPKTAPSSRAAVSSGEVR